jgi:hypothetical protein
MVMVAVEVTPPAGSITPLAWAIIGVLAGVCSTVIPALWVRGNKIQDRMYRDLKECNDKKVKSEEDVLGILKVLRLQMEQSKGGRKS